LAQVPFGSSAKNRRRLKRFNYLNAQEALALAGAFCFMKWPRAASSSRCAASAGLQRTRQVRPPGPSKRVPRPRLDGSCVLGIFAVSPYESELAVDCRRFRRPTVDDDVPGLLSNVFVIR
jgi:hypothetical protein